MLKRAVQLLSACAILSFVFSTGGTASVRAAGVCYVDASATGTNTGSSWTNAYVDLQVALSNIACSEIWVASGFYSPDTTISYTVPAGVAVYGGFAGSETARDQRNPTAHVTILSGDIDHNDTNTDGNRIDETTADINGSNSQHVVIMQGTALQPITSSTVLDGFVITGGQAQGLALPDDGGGGLVCEATGGGGTCSPTLANLVFSGNLGVYGGGLLNWGEAGNTSSPALTNVSFTGNRAFNQGGGMDNDGNGGTSSPILSGVAFNANQADGYGGALYNDGRNGGTSSPTISNSTFSRNQADYGGATYSSGAAAGTSNPRLINVTLSSNVANWGGAMYNFAGSGTVNPTLNGVTFNGNFALNIAGAMLNENAFGGTLSPSIIYTILWTDSAGASPEIYNDGATPFFVSSDVEGSHGSGASWDTTLGVDDGNNIDADPKLAPLADNGGFAQTMALQAGSAAINPGIDFLCQSHDERGVPRPQGPHCDMGAFEHTQFVRADFNADRTSDLAVFRPSTGAWYVKNQFNTIWGQSGDVPVPADYNEDGHVDIAVWRPSLGLWLVNGVFNSAWGTSGDVPVPGDYNGDGKIDLAVWRPSNGTWYVKGGSIMTWGQSGDIPVPGDYDGDGKTDLAVFRPSTDVWYIKGVGNFTWGASGDVPVQADYNGDAVTDIAVWRPSTGIWYVRGLFNSAWGSSTDLPVPGDFNGDGHADVAIWRPSTGQWMVKNQFTTTWGTSGDFPVVAPDTNGNGTPYQ